MQFEKPPGVCRSRGSDVRELKRDVTVRLAEEVLESGGLTRLPGAGQHYSGKFRCRPVEHRLQGTFEV
ncbi:MAG: hypothetical protein Q7V36_02800, partial [Deltaproteobacteria bacterium]|nr:hypothetical protein [Deltaproteobacteria bacterium]